MKINGINVQGAFEFLPGLEYQKGDLIIYSGNLYRVLATFTGLESGGATPASSGLCELYTDSLSSDILTADQVPSILNKYIAGVSLGGIISFMGTIEEVSDLNNYVTNAIYRIIYEGQSCLLRIYQLNDGTIVQEIVDYTTPAMYYRIKSNDTWSGLRAIKSRTKDEFDTYLGALVDAAQNCEDLVARIEKKRSCYCYEVIDPDSDGSYYCGDLDNSILQLIVTYDLGSGRIQDFLTLDPKSVNDDNQAVRSVGGRTIIISIDESSSSITLPIKDNHIDIKIEKVLKLNKK